ncbi:MAG TPA: ABC transporter ATP-binding protein [Thermoanaerobaculia bacterium]|nr:ABC transporter ATP-binding protein [Thermoanaerobaculia bacterium]
MLELRTVTKRFGHVVANDRVSIAVRTGTIHAIVGENGAGKSTAMRIAYGFYRPDDGAIAVDGKVVDIRSPHDAIAAGVGMVHQHFMLVETMTVTENIVLGDEPGGIAVDFEAAAEKVARLSSEYGLAIDPRARIEDLSVGQQQRVELLKLLYRNARILILDEPTAVLTPQEVVEIFAILRSMRAAGKTIVIITHKLSEVLALSDEVTVMRDGKVVGRKATAQTDAADLARMMVGREVLLRVNKGAASPRAEVLTVRNLRVTAPDGSVRVDSVSLSVRGGEIVGIAGVEGNGQTELIEALAGLSARARVSGSILFDEREIVRHTPRARRRLGIAHVPEDRHRRGLLLDFDLRENAILGSHDRKELGRGGMLDGGAILEKTRRIIAGSDVRPTDPNAQARTLSGGNQQKLVIGRELDAAPRLLLVAQPTRGVDIGAIEFIHRQLIDLRDAGCAILLVSAELEEVTSLADRLLVMKSGAVVGEVDPATTPVETIGLMMTGGERKVAK